MSLSRNSQKADKFPSTQKVVTFQFQSLLKVAL